MTSKFKKKKGSCIRLLKFFFTPKPNFFGSLTTHKCINSEDSDQFNLKVFIWSKLPLSSSNMGIFWMQNFTGNSCICISHGDSGLTNIIWISKRSHHQGIYINYNSRFNCTFLNLIIIGYIKHWICNLILINSRLNLREIQWKKNGW